MIRQERNSPLIRTWTPLLMASLPVIAVLMIMIQYKHVTSHYLNPVGREKMRPTLFDDAAPSPPHMDVVWSGKPRIETVQVNCSAIILTINNGKTMNINLNSNKASNSKFIFLSLKIFILWDICRCPWCNSLCG